MPLSLTRHPSFSRLYAGPLIVQYQKLHHRAPTFYAGMSGHLRTWSISLLLTLEFRQHELTIDFLLPRK